VPSGDSYIGRRAVGAGSLEIDPEFGVDIDDQSVWAQSLTYARKKKGLPTAQAVDLESAITGIKITDTIKGSSTIVLSLEDPDWTLVDSGFFDMDEDGKLDSIDVNYPADSKLWWRCTQIGISANRAGAKIEMTFMERTAAWLLNKIGPKKTSRGKKTRAEFFKSLTDEVKAGGGIEFVSKQLHVKQPIGTDTAAETSVAPGKRLLYIGDSLGVGTVPELEKRVRYPVDDHCSVGQPSSWGEGQLGSALTPDHFAVVFDMGTNDGNTPTAFTDRLDRIRVTIKPRPLIIATLNGPAAGMNDEIRAYADSREDVRLVGWAGKAPASPDGIHGNYGDRAQLFASRIPKPTLDGKPATTEKKSKDAKSPGIHGDDDVTIKGVKIDPEQKDNIEKALQVAERLNAPGVAVQALCCAGIGESGFRNVVNSLGYGGVFQGQVETGGRYFTKEDTEAEAECFLKGGKGFGAGGAIQLANEGHWTPGDIATKVEVSGQPGAFYGQWLPEAKKMIEAFGGAGLDAADGGSGGSWQTKSYNFEVGSEQNPRETYWDAMNRLADEVQWAFFVDGQLVFYDPETSLIRQLPAAVVRRLDPDVVSFQANWDTRMIATEATLELICSPFEFRAGDVFKLIGFGPASTGSTVSLPGRWLIEEVTRDRFNLVSTFQLKQPTKPKSEPIPERSFKADEKDAADASSAASLDGTLRDKIVQIATESIGKPPNTHYDQKGSLTDKVHPNEGERSDCSQWVRAVYLQAGAQDPGSYTGAMMTKGHQTKHPLPGDIIVSASHVELYIGNGKTIGHGTSDIDMGDAAYYVNNMGMLYWTYDFLGQKESSTSLSVTKEDQRSPIVTAALPSITSAAE
jgi:hypothetical protein